MTTQTLEVIKLDTPELGVIEESKAVQIKATFEPMVAMIEGFEEAFNGIINEAQKENTKEVASKAKRLRLDIAKVRIETEKARVAEKGEYLRAGKAIDGVANILKWAVTDKENKLKEIENYFEIQDQKRLEALQSERVEKLSKYVEDAQERDLSSMDTDVWEAYLSTKKKELEDRIEAEKKVEADRIAKEKAEKEEQERIRLENDKLKKEAEEAEKAMQAEREAKEKQLSDERAKAESERKVIEEQARKEREEAEAKAKKEAEAKAKIEAELKTKKDADLKAQEELKAATELELSKGDKEKFQTVITDLTSLKSKYSFKSEKYKKLQTQVNELIDKIIVFSEGK